MRIIEEYSVFLFLMHFYSLLLKAHATTTYFIQDRAGEMFFQLHEIRLKLSGWWFHFQYVNYC